MAIKKNKKFKLTRLQRLWLETLESGKYKKAKGVLARINSKNEVVSCCCLGVLCETALKMGVIGEKDIVSFSNRTRVYKGDSFYLPSIVAEKAKMHQEGHVRGHDAINSLVDLNDSGWSHPKIAKFIRKNPEKVFYA